MQRSTKLYDVRSAKKTTKVTLQLKSDIITFDLEEVRSYLKKYGYFDTCKDTHPYARVKILRHITKRFIKKRIFFLWNNNVTPKIGKRKEKGGKIFE